MDDRVLGGLLLGHETYPYSRSLPLCKGYWGPRPAGFQITLPCAALSHTRIILHTQPLVQKECQ